MLSGCQLQVLKSTTSSDVSICKVVVTGFGNQISGDMLEMYFESKKSGGKEGSIKECVIIKEGIAYVIFNDPEG